MLLTFSERFTYQGLQIVRLLHNLRIEFGWITLGRSDIPMLFAGVRGDSHYHGRIAMRYTCSPLHLQLHINVHYILSAAPAET